MVYIPVDQTENQLALVDRAGARRPLKVPPGRYTTPRVSPDGTRLAVDRDSDDGRERSVWIYDLNDSAPIHKLTFEGRSYSPVWTRDNARVVFTSDREGDLGLFSAARRRWGGGASAREVRPGHPPPGRIVVAGWEGADCYAQNRWVRISAGSSGILALSPGAEQKPTLVAQPPATDASLSPDGHWLAYLSGESGRNEDATVQPFPPTGEKHQIPPTEARSPCGRRTDSNCSS